MKKSFLIVLIMLLSLQIFAQVRYVTPSGAGNLSGTGWANASNDLQTMINASASGEEVWVAAGVYKPNRLEHDLGIIRGPDRLVAFKLKDGVKLYGGFTGSESLLADRNWSNNKTILSGDVDNNDVVLNGITTSVIGSNTAHVIISSGLSNATVVDGFFITGGYTLNISGPKVNGITINPNYGSGIANYSSSITVANCTFTGIEGEGAGGGIFNDNASPSITNCTFSNNLVYKSGAGILNNSSSPVIKDCTFFKNIAGTIGAAMYNSTSSPNVTNCTFTDNMSNSTGGAIFNTSFPCSPVFSKCTFTGNKGYYGGAVYNFFTATPTFSGCSFINNTADNDGGAIYSTAGGGSINIMNGLFLNNHANGSTSSGGGIWTSNSSNNSSIINCTFYGNTAFDGQAIFSNSEILKVYNSIVLGTTTGGSYEFKNSIAEGLAGGVNGNLDGTGITANQLFTNATSGNLTLAANSPAINAANNILYTNAGGNPVTDKDLAGNARLVDATLDMGSYEFDATILPLKFGTITAKQDNDDVVITWQTYDEINTAGFEIAFSTDGNKFEKIAVVPSANTTGIHTYSYKHLQPVGTVLFYRIKQVDTDASFNYSSVVKIKMNRNIQVSLYPNPVADILHVKNINPQEQDIIQVISTGGKQLLQLKATSNPRLDIKNLLPGIYLLRVINKDKSSKVLSFMKK